MKTIVNSISIYNDSDGEKTLFFNIHKRTPLITKLENDGVLCESARINSFFVNNHDDINVEYFKRLLNHLGLSTEHTEFIDEKHKEYNSLNCNESEAKKIISNWEQYSMYNVNDVIRATNYKLYKFLINKIAKDYSKPSYAYCEKLSKEINKKFKMQTNVYDIMFIFESLLVCYLDNFCHYKNEYIYKAT